MKQSLREKFKNSKFQNLAKKLRKTSFMAATSCLALGAGNSMAQSPVWGFTDINHNHQKVTFDALGRMTVSPITHRIQDFSATGAVISTYPSRNATLQTSSDPSHDPDINLWLAQEFIDEPWFNRSGLEVGLYDGTSLGRSPLLTTNTNMSPNAFPYNSLEHTDYIITPLPGDCGGYNVIIAYIGDPNQNRGQLVYWLTQSDPSWTSGPYHMQGITHLGTYGNMINFPSAKGKLALQKPVSNIGNTYQYLYLSLGDDAGTDAGIYKFILQGPPSSGSWANYPFLTTDFNPSQKNLAQSRIIGPSQVAGGATFDTEELELNAQGNKIAWAGTATQTLVAEAYIANLNSNGLLSGSVGKTQVNGVSNGTITGLEFNPNTGSNNLLYLSAGLDNGANPADGLYYIQENAGLYSPVRVNHSLSGRVSKSYIEANVNGKLNMFIANSGPVRLAEFDPAANTFGSFVVLNARPEANGARKIQKQLDGWHYNNSILTGPTSLKVTNGPCPQPYPPVPANSTGSYKATLVPNATYSWSVTGGGGSASVNATGANTADITFPALTGTHTYTVQITITGYSGACGLPIIQQLTVTTNDGCPIDQSRVAQTTPKAGIYPNPANDVVSVTLVDGTEAASIKIYDTKGSLVKTGNVKGREYQLNVSNLENGLYLIYITDDKNNTTTQKILIQH